MENSEAQGNSLLSAEKNGRTATVLSNLASVLILNSLRVGLKLQNPDTILHDPKCSVSNFSTALDLTVMVKQNVLCTSDGLLSLELLPSRPISH